MSDENRFPGVRGKVSVIQGRVHIEPKLTVSPSTGGMEGLTRVLQGSYSPGANKKASKRNYAPS